MQRGKSLSFKKQEIIISCFSGSPRGGGEELGETAVFSSYLAGWLSTALARGPFLTVHSGSAGLLHFSEKQNCFLEKSKRDNSTDEIYKRKGFPHSMATGSVLLHFQLEPPEERRRQISMRRPFKFVVALGGCFCSDTTDAFSKADFQRRLSILSFISTVAFILRRTLTVSAIPWRAAMCKGVAPLQSLSSTRAPFLMSNVELVDHVINFL